MGAANPVDALLLPRFLNQLHSNTAILVNKRAGVTGRQVWRQYWDTLLRTEGDFWSRVNYIWWNPVKHGFCRRPEDWPWTSLHAVMAEPDDEVRRSLERFPPPGRLPGDDY